MKRPQNSGHCLPIPVPPLPLSTLCSLLVSFLLNFANSYHFKTMQMIHMPMHHWFVDILSSTAFFINAIGHIGHAGLRDEREREQFALFVGVIGAVCSTDSERLSLHVYDWKGSFCLLFVFEHDFCNTFAIVIVNAYRLSHSSADSCVLARFSQVPANLSVIWQPLYYCCPRVSIIRVPETSPHICQRGKG